MNSNQFNDSNVYMQLMKELQSERVNKNDALLLKRKIQKISK